MLAECSRIRYAVHDTHAAHASSPICLRTRCAMSGTHVQYGATRLATVVYLLGVASLP